MASFLRPATADADHSLFVGDLAPDVTDYLLQETFRQYYPTVRSAKVITDPLTGRSKGYGFVRFADEGQRDDALSRMQGFQISGRPVRVSVATARRSSGAGNMVHPSELDPTNTTLFIGGLSATVTEDQLRALFVPFGDIVYTKIPQGKGCGFVQFVERRCAEAAMADLNGHALGGSAIRISWGRSTSRAAAASTLTTQLPASAYGLGAGAAGAVYGAPGGGGGAAYPTALYAGQAGGAAGGYDPAAAAAAALGYGPYAAAAAGAFGPSAAGAAFAAGALTADQYGNLFSAASAPETAAAYTAAALQGGGGYGGMAANAASLQAAAAAAQAAAAAGQPFDPLAPADFAKLNLAFMARQQPSLLGSHLRAL